MSLILTTLLPALLPVIIDMVKVGWSKIIGVPTGEPMTFNERLEEKRLDIEKLKALAGLDKPTGNISQWVADLRASFRYIAVGVIVLAAIVYNFLPESYQNSVALNYLNQLGASATFFIIGDRVYLGLKHLK
ncbi:hypothetical protein ES703_10211 [subsurface metagenome]